MIHNYTQQYLIVKKIHVTSILLGLLFYCLVFSVNAADDRMFLDQWLAKQVTIKTWTADVIQTRKIKSLLRPLESKGQVWFVLPNQFRWQLGNPPRTIAVRNRQELLIAYPKLKQLERYPFDDINDPAMQQALALLDVGFPSNAEHFLARYELLSVTTAGEIRQFELQPKDEQARRLLVKVRLSVSTNNLVLQSTELEFPDGSTMRNSFSQHKINIDIDESLFQLDTKDYQVVEPLKNSE